MTAVPEPLWQIKLIIESDDEAEVERVAEQVSRAACPTLPGDITVDHECEIPWMVVTSRIEGDEAEGWRDALNR